MYLYSVGTPNSTTSLLTADQMGSDNAAPGTPKAAEAMAPARPLEKTGGISDGLKLLIGAGGIYGAFLYYGSLQEDVFRFVAPDGSKFSQAWFLQVLEALANVIIGFVGMQVTGPTKGIPLRSQCQGMH
jgi:hypothetical protein